MDKLLCPDCGHDISAHGFHNTGLPCGYFDDQSDCHCNKSQDEIRRAAAIAHLREIAKPVCNYRKWEMLNSVSLQMKKVEEAIAAYRAVGILPTKERKP